MLADPRIHVVDITGYPDQHAAQFIARRKAGKHVIIEKPLAIEWNDILAMRKAAVESGMQGLRLLRVPLLLAVPRHQVGDRRRPVRQLHYGEIDYYHGIGPWYGQYRWNTKRELGGSALLTAGCHALDALLLCMGSDVEEVTSYATQSAEPALQGLRVSDHLDDDPEVQERRGGEVRSRRGLPAALLLPHPPGRQRGQPARQQVPLAEARRAESRSVEPAVDEDARQRRRRRPSVSDAVPGVLRCARSPARRCRSPASPTASPRTRSSRRPIDRRKRESR